MVCLNGFLCHLYFLVRRNILVLGFRYVSIYEVKVDLYFAGNCIFLLIV